MVENLQVCHSDIIVRLRDDQVAQCKHRYKNSAEELKHEDGEGHEEHEHNPQCQEEGCVQYGALSRSLEFFVKGTELGSGALDVELVRLHKNEEVVYCNSNEWAVDHAPNFSMCSYNTESKESKEHDSEGQAIEHKFKCSFNTPVDLNVCVLEHDLHEQHNQENSSNKRDEPRDKATSRFMSTVRCGGLLV